MTTTRGDYEAAAAVMRRYAGARGAVLNASTRAYGDPPQEHTALDWRVSMREAPDIAALAMRIAVETGVAHLSTCTHHDATVALMLIVTHHPEASTTPDAGDEIAAGRT